MQKTQEQSIMMVIDDTSMIQSHISSEILEKFQVIYENDGKHALDLIKSKQPNIYLIQLMLSQMDSLEICQRIRSIEFSNRPLIILISNTPYSKSIHDVVIKNGADQILFPPLQDQSIEQLILKHPYALSS